MKVTTSMVYAAANPCQVITSAPSSGPKVKPRLNDAMFSADAAGISYLSSSRGTIALRAGLLTA